VWNVFRQARRVFPRLLGHAAQRHSFRLGFQDACGFPVYKEEVVHRPLVGWKLPHGHPLPGPQVKLVHALDLPPCFFKHGVDVLAGLVFGAFGHGFAATGTFSRCSSAHFKVTALLLNVY
jgi:hypothetical protein